MVVKSNGSPFVQQPVLEKLICTKCKKYLSVPPIYMHPQQGAVCGRCPIENFENFTRIEIYELAIQFQKFPCSYQERGCLENLFPTEILDHENRCIYKIHDCPTRVYNNCIWQGYVGDMLEHFEKKHPTFILKDCQFEIDFLNSHKEYYIMPYGDDLFIVTREADSSKITFALTVSYIGPNIEVESYTYDVTLESGNKSYKYTVSEDIGKTLNFNGELLNDMLHDPVTVVAYIDIKESSKLNLSSLNGSNGVNGDEETLNPNINLDQLSELECPVCMEYMTPPIYQCISGHSICSICKETQKECPICRKAFERTQNYALERIIKNMNYPCKHSGCKYFTKPKDIKKHEASCIFGPFKCPLMDYENCKEIFSIGNLFDHVKTNHYESLIEIDTVSIPFDENVEEDISECYIIKYLTMLFRLSFLYSKEDDTFYWAVQLIGPSEESTKYKFDLEIIDNNGKNNRLYIKANCASLTDKCNVFEDEENYILLDYDLIFRYIKNQLTFRIRISNNDI